MKPPVKKACGWLKRRSVCWRYRPVLAVGRDGIKDSHGQQVTKKPAPPRSPSTTVVNARARSTWGTCPKNADHDLSMDALINKVLATWHDQQGDCPRLWWSHRRRPPSARLHRCKARKLPDSGCGRRTPKGNLLAVGSRRHACGYVKKWPWPCLARAPRPTSGSAACRWPRDRPKASRRCCVWPAPAPSDPPPTQQGPRRGIPGRQRFLRKNAARWMQYATYRRHGTPIGSGVTEAGCKTVFTQRPKRSGMSWCKDSGQVIVGTAHPALKRCVSTGWACTSRPQVCSIEASGIRPIAQTFKKP